MDRQANTYIDTFTYTRTHAYAPAAVDETRDDRAQIAQRNHTGFSRDHSEVGGDGRNHQEGEDITRLHGGGKEEKRGVCGPESWHADDGDLHLLGEQDVVRTQLDR